jgi:hypothetical protein
MGRRNREVMLGVLFVCVVFVVVMFASARDVQLLLFLNDMTVLMSLISEKKKK